MAITTDQVRDLNHINMGTARMALGSIVKAIQDAATVLTAVVAGHTTSITTTLPGRISPLETACSTTLPGRISPLETACNTTLPGRISPLETACSTTLPGRISPLETACSTTLPGRISPLETACVTTFPAQILALQNKYRDPVVYNISGNIVASLGATAVYVAPHAGKIVAAYLQLGETGADGTDPLSYELDVLIGGVTCFTAKPKLTSAAADGASSLIAGAGVTVGVINAAANTLVAGNIVTITGTLVRTTPETEMANAHILVVFENTP